MQLVHVKKIERFSLVMSCPYFAFASGIRNSGLWNPENPQLKESGIPLKIEIWNLSSTDRESAGESSSWNPESKTVLDFLTHYVVHNP